MSVSGKQILVVDDDETFRNRLSKALVRRGFEVKPAGSVDEAKRVLESGWFPDFAVVDLRMPGANGMTLVATLCSMSELIRVVVLTAYGSITNAIEAVKLGAVDYLTKPADADQITAALLGDKSKPENESEPSAITLEQVEWEHIQRTLLSNEGNISATARSLGIHRRSLQRKLSKWSPWQTEIHKTES